LGDFLAIVASTYIFLKYSNTTEVSWNGFLINNMVTISVITWLISSLYFRLYSIETTFNLDTFYRHTWRAFLAQRILWQGFIFLFQGNTQYHIGLQCNLYQESFWIIYLVLSRALITLLLFNIKSSLNKLFNVAIWGFNRTSIGLAATLESNVTFINFRGILNEECDEVFATNEDFKQSLTEAITTAHANNIDELYIVTASEHIIDLHYYFELADNFCMRLKFVPDLSNISTEPFSTANFNNFQVIKPRNEPLQNAYNRLIKRIYDLIFSTLVIVFILSWLYPIMACIIKYQSKGPVLFKQLRTGKKNKSFWCYKFRSMEVNQSSDSLQAQKEDPRVTPIGRFIRKTSLDELPQFFNVFRGDMSIVGPRPHMLKHTEDYNELISNFMVRHFVKPGITGLAQVSGHRGETKKVSDMKKRVNADILYVQNWSLIKDIKICFLTIFVTLKGDKNAF
jgi:Undecaprenyl-phosphate glucose phosphotransferase